jgi:hypothetical protein
MHLRVGDTGICRRLERTGDVGDVVGAKLLAIAASPDCITTNCIPNLTGHKL